MEVLEMEKKTIRNISYVGICLLIVVIVSIVAFVHSCSKKDIGPCIEYKCDVKVINLATTIEIDKQNEDFAKVSGNIIKFITDPLTMYDLNGNKIAYAGDSYNFIAQDSHSIYVDEIMSVEMVGLVNFFGESYDIYNKDGEKIANATFDPFNTKGEMYDTNGKLIADFNSKLFFFDFDVRITEECNLDEKTVLMIFCSYYSDQSADAKTSNSSSTAKRSGS
jgi:hypothetical protein